MSVDTSSITILKCSLFFTFVTGESGSVAMRTTLAQTGQRSLTIYITALFDMQRPRHHDSVNGR